MNSFTMYGLLWNPSAFVDGAMNESGMGSYTAIAQPLVFMLNENGKKVHVSVFTGPFVEGKPVLMLQIEERVFGTKRQAAAWARGCLDMQRVMAGNERLRKEMGKLAKKMNRNN